MKSPDLHRKAMFPNIYFHVSAAEVELVSLQKFFFLEITSSAQKIQCPHHPHMGEEVLMYNFLLLEIE